MDYDKNKYKAVRWTNLKIINWIINPGLAINELILGQRVPRILLEEKQAAEVKSANRFVPCPHCGTIHNESVWSQHNAFRNWFGLYCPGCGNTIPCIRNLTSLVFLILTAPLWILFFKRIKQKWIAQQPERFNNVNFSKEAEESSLWLKAGLSWAGLMYVLSIFINPLFTGEEINKWLIVIGIPVWIIGGLCLAYILKNISWGLKTSE